jgi:hypothetical protein
MECREVQNQLMELQEPNPQVAQHIDGCDDCRRYYADILAVRSAFGTPVQTPSSLRKRTLVRCSELLAERTTATAPSWRQRCRRVLDSPRFVAIAATVSVVVLITVTTSQIDNIQDEATSLFVKLAVTLVVAQNLFTALFLPALLMLRSRFVLVPSRAVNSGA